MNDKAACFRGYRCYTHTLQMVASGSSLPLEELTAKAAPYSPRPANFKARGLLIPLNANKFAGADIQSLSTLNSVLNEIQKELKISEWLIDRQDLAIDSKQSFSELQKIFLYLAALLALHTNNKNAKINTDLASLQVDSIRVASRRFEVQCYNKLKESNGKHPYSRCEFRFKLLGTTDIAAATKQAETILTALPSHIEELNAQRVQMLLEVWQREGCKSFSEFVRRYEGHIFNREILSQLYSRIMKGNDFKQWLYHFKKRNQLKLISGKDVVTVCKKMKKALANYAET